MPTKYGHTNIICEDWKTLTQFYIQVFDCQPVPPERDQSGEWLEKGTGVPNAHLRGMHLRLPGWGDDGPTLEIYSYSEMLDKPSPSAAHRKGFGHIAFQVDDVEGTIEKAIALGGRRHGEVATRNVPGAGTITFTYIQDPEGNIIEIQRWS